MNREAPQTTLQRMRLAAGLSLRELERRTGINRGSLSRIERGWLATEAETAKILAALREGTPEDDAA